ncbi:hypothetical protein DFS34DRAFT_628610 [Phlyctochytrium arcticum]|nr:hypothetical protein DFS34DRAFT_628610 [Phlyctochytrium arcticum]
MASEGSHHHRSKLKQANKPFKSKHATKGAQKANTKGKVDGSVKNKHKLSSAATKADRRNHAKLIQQRKRSEVVSSNRLFQGPSGAPKIVAVIPLCPDVDAWKVVKEFAAGVDGEKEDAGMDVENTSTSGDSKTITIYIERFKQKLQFLPVGRHLLHILDAVKVADFLVFVMSSEVEVDEFGELCLKTIKAQGVPSHMSVVQHLDRIPTKKQQDIRDALNAYMEHHFPNDAKLFFTTQPSESVNALRYLTQQRPKPVVWRERHAYMLADSVNFEATSEDQQTGRLAITGYVRGNFLSANRLIHIPNHGDYQIEQILSAAPAPLSSLGIKNPKVDQGMSTDPVVLDRPDPELQEGLVAENTPDPMDNEQTWPTNQELMDAEERVKALNGDAPSESDAAALKKKTKRVPKGTSTYQAAWIMEDEDEDQADDEEEDVDENGDVTMGDASGALGAPVDWSSMNLGPKRFSGESNHSAKENEDDDEEYEDVEVEDRNAGNVEDEHADLSETEEQNQYDEYLKKQKAEREDLEFPDEVDTPKDIPARVRFQRYRGLKSFRTSPWDPYENLPVDYSRIFQFKNFRRTKRKVFDMLEESGVAAGTLVTIYLKEVPRAVHDSFITNPTNPFILFSLLPHEQKFSVLNFILTRNTEYNDPVKSKDAMLVQCGFRRYLTNPVYSSDTRGANNVHKFERFLQGGRNAVGTIYAPIQFGPAPILMFKPDAVKGMHWEADSSEGGAESVSPYVAHGSVLDLDPTRILAKRLILTAHPFKVHKRGAVLRYMFWHPSDIHYFKPIQLSTKLGRIGHIKESLGTHGYMKAVFDGPLKGQDTVCMYLYKRVFPKWTTSLYVEGSDLSDATKEAGANEMMMD